MPNTPEQLPSPEFLQQPEGGNMITESLGGAAVRAESEAGSDEVRTSYDILRNNYAPEKELQLLRSYVRNTGRLIERIQDRDIDYVVYLDKSARPVSWLVDELWSDMANPDENGVVPPKPQAKFVNIDREHWRDQTGGREVGSGIINVDSVDQEVIDSLRGIFVEDGDEAVPVRDTKTYFTDKNVLIVDEVESTGDTLEIALQLFRRAFPDANLSKHTWMRSKAARTVGLPDIPVWYTDKTTRGRGVDDRSFDKSQQSPSSRQRNGWMFLSTRYEHPDSQSDQLRAEIKQLASDYRAQKLDLNHLGQAETGVR